MSNSNPETMLFQEKNQELSAYIEQLSKAQQDLTIAITNTSDQTEQARLSTNLVLIQESRSNLMNALSSINSYYTHNLVGSSQTLEQQTNAVAIIDKEMQIAKKRLAYINEQKENKLRVVEINQYYGSSYAEWTYLVQILILTIVAFMIVLKLNKSFSGIPQAVFSITMFLIGAVSLYYIVNVLISIYSRDSMVYDQYNWNFNASNAPKIDTGVKTKNPFKLPTLTTCIGSDCCLDPLDWNATEGKCDPQVSTTTSKCSSSIF
jgi:hypothetical protein